MLFLTYGNSLVYEPEGIVPAFSVLDDGGAEMLAARMVITSLVLLAPLLLLARRWSLPRGAVTLTYSTVALISSMLTGFENIVIALAAVAAGVVVDVLAAWLQQSGRRRGARWAFGLAAPFVTSVIYLGAASMAAGRMPAVVELWTGAPIVMGLLGWALAALMLPNPLTGSADVVRS